VPLKRLGRGGREACPPRGLSRGIRLWRDDLSLSGELTPLERRRTHLERRGLLDVSEEPLALVRPSKPPTRPESLLRGGGRVSRGPSLGGLWRGIGLLRGHRSLSRDLTPLKRRRIHLERRGLPGASEETPPLARPSGHLERPEASPEAQLWIFRGTSLGCISVGLWRAHPLRRLSWPLKMRGVSEEARGASPEAGLSTVS